MTAVPTTRYARSGGAHIAYQLSGEGAVDLLLVPDGFVPIEAMHEEPSFDRFLGRLATFSRLIVFDRRGLGLSDPVSPGDPPTLEQWMSDAEAVLEAAGSQRAALLGMAEGGFVLTLLAATRPARVSALVLVNATPGFSAEPFRRWGSAAEAIDRLERQLDVADYESAWAIPLFAPTAAHDERYRDWLMSAMRRSASPAMAKAVFDVMFRSDVRDVLAAIRVPTLVVHRRGDHYLGPEHGRYLAEHIPEARYAEVEGDDHVPYIGDQGPILAAIEEFLTGRRALGVVDRLLATVLFTDIAAATEMAARVGDERWRQLLLDHHAAVRRELARFAGREIDTAGDGFFATFDGPGRAVRCACAIVAAVEGLGLQIRAGLHTGECETIGSKLGGIAVHIGARIAALSRPGEVLVSSTVKDLVAGSGIAFDDRGWHKLRGVPQRYRLYAVDRPSTLVGH